MILAAGRGERMRPISDRTPKPLLEVRGETLIERHLRACARAGILRVVVNLSWLGTQIRERLGDGGRYGVAISYSDEGSRPLDTAGGILRALPLLAPGPFAVINGDIYCDYPLARLAVAEDAEAHIVLVPNPRQHPLGDFGLGEGKALAEAPVRHTFGCLAVYRTSFFAGCADGPLPLKPLLLRAMARQRCTAELYSGVWEDVGTPERLHALNAP
jgi:MurNAc alpha-1-phosphate uridylyltransferase